MKIFELIRQLKESIERNKKSYSGDYVNGYADCLSDLTDKVINLIEIEIK